MSQDSTSFSDAENDLQDVVKIAEFKKRVSWPESEQFDLGVTEMPVQPIFRLAAIQMPKIGSDSRFNTRALWRGLAN